MKFSNPHPALMGITLGAGASTALIGMVAEQPWISVLGLIACVVVLFLDEI